MIIFLKEFLTNITIWSIVVGGASFVLKTLVDNFFSHKIEQYKSELDRENTKHRIVFEKLQTERAIVIKETYKRIVIVNKAFRSYMNPFQFAGDLNKEEKQKEAAKSANDFIDYFEQNRIFFEESLAKKIDEIKNILWDAWHDFMLSRELRQEDVKAANEKWGNAWNILERKIPEIKIDIENKFRSVIGIE